MSKPKQEGGNDMNLVKLRFLRDGKPQGREYSYISKEKVEVGDIVVIREPDYPESEVEKFKDRLKEIIGKIEEKQE